jgi:HEPN domain-containing protein
MATSRDLARLLLSRAAEDEAAARELLPVDRVTDAIIAFHAQQAVEKVLKAVLASREVEFPFTHDLRALEEQCASNGITIPSELDDLDLLTPYAARARYEAPDPATVDRKTALALASAALEWAVRLIDE